MLVALNAISASQSKATENITADIVHLLDFAADFAATHSNAILRYQRSNLVLHIHSDATFLVPVLPIVPKLPVGNQPTMAVHCTMRWDLGGGPVDHPTYAVCV
jgi:hypothetical protein